MDDTLCVYMFSPFVTFCGCAINEPGKKGTGQTKQPSFTLLIIPVRVAESVSVAKQAIGRVRLCEVAFVGVAIF